MLAQQFVRRCPAVTPNNQNSMTFHIDWQSVILPFFLFSNHKTASSYMPHHTFSHIAPAFLWFNYCFNCNQLAFIWLFNNGPFSLYVATLVAWFSSLARECTIYIYIAAARRECRIVSNRIRFDAMPPRNDRRAAYPCAMPLLVTIASAFKLIALCALHIHPHGCGIWRNLEQSGAVCAMPLQKGKRLSLFDSNIWHKLTS